MCGRYFYTKLDRIKEISESLYMMLISVFGNEDCIEICPGTEAPVIIRKAEGYYIGNKKWGFVSGDKGLIINARVETIKEKKTFRDLAYNNRCVIPASGYYEWRKNDRLKFSFRPEDSSDILYIAGLYREEEDGSKYVVLTRNPTEDVSGIHDSMPLILPGIQAAMGWLDGENSNVYLQETIRLKIQAVGDEQLTMQF